MSDILSAENIGNVITYLAPGYLSAGVYRSVFTKKTLNDTPMLITSAVYSLPIVAVANQIVLYVNKEWHSHPFHLVAQSNNLAYVLLLICLSVIGGYLMVLVRQWKTVEWVLDKLNFAPPEPNVYLRAMKVDHKFALSAVILKDGPKFGGILTKQQADDNEETKALYFSRVRWPDSHGPNGWGPETKSAILVPLENVKYIEFGPPLATTNGKQWFWQKIWRYCKKMGAALLSW